MEQYSDTIKEIYLEKHIIKRYPKLVKKIKDIDCKLIELEDKQFLNIYSGMYGKLWYNMRDKLII